jgi:hypothetical protein
MNRMLNGFRVRKLGFHFDRRCGRQQFAAVLKAFASDSISIWQFFVPYVAGCSSCVIEKHGSLAAKRRRGIDAKSTPCWNQGCCQCHTRPNIGSAIV